MTENGRVQGRRWLFDDCEFGAVPPVGAAYGLPVLLDESLDGASELHFEAGDHTIILLLLHAVDAGADAAEAASPLVFHRSGFGRMATPA